MINFRFHLVSLVAVFLALTVGIVMGATVIDRAIVDSLNDRITAVSDRADERKAESEALSADVGRLNEFVGESQPFVVENRLTDVPVVVLATRGIDDAVVSSQVDVLRQAGAAVPAVIWLEESWALGDDRSANALGEALGEDSREAGTLRNAAWRVLAARLHNGKAIPEVNPPAATSVVNPDALSALVDAGFLEVAGVTDGDVDLGAFPGSNARAVLLSAAGSAPGNLLRSGARALSGAGIPTVVGEIYAGTTASTPRGRTLDPIRAGEPLVGVSTVDDVELPEGRMAVALAGSDLGRQPPVTGHYGYGDGATSALPPFEAQP
ncbi:MAG: copper transporter [Acidimicrobiia bacterium]